jgi:hypothetical protein
MIANQHLTAMTIQLAHHQLQTAPMTLARQIMTTATTPTVDPVTEKTLHQLQLWLCATTTIALSNQPNQLITSRSATTNVATSQNVAIATKTAPVQQALQRRKKMTVKTASTIVQLLNRKSVHRKEALLNQKNLQFQPTSLPSTV